MARSKVKSRSHYDIAHLHVPTHILSERTFPGTTDLINRAFKVAFAQLWNELKGCNFTVV